LLGHLQIMKMNSEEGKSQFSDLQTVCAINKR
jgi:hypothetical protein